MTYYLKENAMPLEDENAPRDNHHHHTENP